MQTLLLFVILFKISEWEAVNEGSKLLSAEKLWAVVIFENAQDSSDGNETDVQHLKYKIRFELFTSTLNKCD